MKQPSITAQGLDHITEAQMQAFAEEFSTIEPGSGVAHVNTHIASSEAWTGFDGLALMGGLATIAIMATLIVFVLPTMLNVFKRLKSSAIAMMAKRADTVATKEPI